MEFRDLHRTQTCTCQERRHRWRPHRALDLVYLLWHRPRTQVWIRVLYSNKREPSLTSAVENLSIVLPWVSCSRHSNLISKEKFDRNFAGLLCTVTLLIITFTMFTGNESCRCLKWRVETSILYYSLLYKHERANYWISNEGRMTDTEYV